MASATSGEWAGLAEDLRRGAPKRAAGSAVLLSALFVIGATGLPRGSALVGFVLFPLVATVGAVAGAVLGTTATIRRALPAFEQGLHRSVEPLMARAVDRALGGERTISVERLRSLLDGAIERAAGAPSGLSPARLLGRFVVRGTLRLVRRLLMREFLARLEARGESHVSAAAVEAFVREKLVRLVVARVETQVGAIHWTVAALAAAAVLGPYLYRWLAG